MMVKIWIDKTLLSMYKIGYGLTGVRYISQVARQRQDVVELDSSEKVNNDLEVKSLTPQNDIVENDASNRIMDNDDVKEDNNNDDMETEK